MSGVQFDEFLHTATGNSPYGHQCPLAYGDDARSDKLKTLAAGRECRWRLITIPTGLRKSAAIAPAWLWNRFRSAIQKSELNRRLFRCLLARLLTEGGC